MVFSDSGRNKLALFMAYGSGTSYPQYCAIGSGSGTALVSNGSLVAEIGSRIAMTGSQNIATNKEVTWIFDVNSLVMSGVNLREFGMFDTNVPTSGTLWNREGFPAVVFDGTNELQIEITFEVF